MSAHLGDDDRAICIQTKAVGYQRIMSSALGLAGADDCFEVPAGGSLAGRPVALASSGEGLQLPFTHARQPVLAVRRWAKPWVADIMGVTQGVQILAVLGDPCVNLSRSTDGPVARDDDISAVRRALEPLQCGEVVLDRVSGVRQVEHRNQDIRKHVAGDENAVFLNQQRRMARSMARLSLRRVTTCTKAGGIGGPRAWRSPRPVGSRGPRAGSRPRGDPTGLW
jgi:hypothetical protein